MGLIKTKREPLSCILIVTSEFLSVLSVERSPLGKLSRIQLTLRGLKMSFLIFDKKWSSSGNLETGGFQLFYLVLMAGDFGLDS